MSYLLDTNTCSRYLNGTSPAILAKLQGLRASEVYLCSVVKAELLYGARKSQPGSQSRQRLALFLSAYRSLPFDDSSAERYAEVRADLEARGMPIGPMDLLIAATALANDFTLVTHNTREFSRVQGLRVEDWQE